MIRHGPGRQAGSAGREPARQSARGGARGAERTGAAREPEAAQGPVAGPPGRGGQLARGAEAALKRAGQDDWLLFLHADTRLQPGWSAEARRFIDNHQGRDRAAYFRFALDDAAPAARRLERFVALRCAALGLPYGDQGLLIEASFYRRLGGYRDMTLFEDVDIVRRIGRARLTGLRSKAVTSADRFRTEGYAKRSARNLALLARYYSGERPETLARAYAPPSSSPSPPRRTPA